MSSLFIEEDHFVPVPSKSKFQKISTPFCSLCDGRVVLPQFAQKKCIHQIQKGLKTFDGDISRSKESFLSVEV